MKKLRLLLGSLCVVVFTLTSCSQDDVTSAPQETPVAVDLLLGKWEMTKIGQKIEKGGKIMLDETDQGRDPDYEQHYTFNADYTVKSYSHNPQSGATFESTDNYERFGDILSIIVGPTKKDYTILTLEKENLRLQDVVETENFKITTVRRFMPIKED